METQEMSTEEIASFHITTLSMLMMCGVKTMKLDDYLKLHEKVKNVLFVRRGDTYVTTDFGNKFMFTVLYHDRDAFDSFMGGAWKNASDKARNDAKDYYRSMSPTTPQLKIKCDLLGVSYDECYECMKEYIGRLYTVEA